MFTKILLAFSFHVVKNLIAMMERYKSFNAKHNKIVYLPLKLELKLKFSFTAYSINFSRYNQRIKLNYLRFAKDFEFILSM